MGEVLSEQDKILNNNLSKENDIAFELRQTLKLAERFARSGVNTNKNQYQISILQMWILRYLYDNREKEVFQKDVERVFEIRRATATEILSNLEKKGYLTRQFFESDARLKKIIITQKALGLKTELEKSMRDFRDKIMQDITIEEQKIMLNIVSKIKHNLINLITEKNQNNQEK